jgi:putative transposase
MSINNPKFHRRSIRLPEYDYSKAGAYYVTICTQDRKCVLGNIVDNKIQLSKIGEIVEECWKWLFEQYLHVSCDIYTIMPNHIHAILVINDEPGRGGSRTAPTVKRKPLGRLLGAFKTVSTKQINMLRNTPGRIIWQRNYYEHVIRNQKSYEQIAEYIYQNPLFWHQDQENPDFKPINNQQPCETNRS